MLKPKTRDGILAVLILAVPIALHVLFDDELLEKIAFVMLVLGVAGVLGLRKYFDRLDRAMAVLPDPAQGGQFDRALLLLKPLEQRVLGIHDLVHPERIRRALHDRRTQFVSIGLAFGVMAVMAVIVLIGIYTW